MAMTHDEVLAIKRELEPEYHKRHAAFRNLRRYWHGDYWNIADRESHPIATIFRDWTARSSDVGPDVKLVHNVVQMVCVKFQTFLSQLPQIRFYVDPPESDLRRAQATLKERYVYGCWSRGQMVQKNTWGAWFLPLMGDYYLGIWPDMDAGLPVPFVRSPEYAYPVMDYTGSVEEATIFSWRVKESVAKRTFPSFTPSDERANSSSSKLLGRLTKGDAQSDADKKGSIEVLEYSDENEWSRWVDGQRVNGVQHNLGFNLFDHVKFIDVPGEPWGHGAVEQAINLNEMGNALYSLMFQAVIENVFPRLVLIDPAKAPEEIETGPGAVIPINQGGSVQWLHPPTQAIAMQEQFLGANTHNIKQASMMGETEFGQSPATSIVTGKAIDALQGAGSGSTIEMVQGSGIGPALTAWNEKAVRVGQRMFRDRRMELYGSMAPGTMEIKGRQFALTLKGSQLIGSGRNDVVFQVAVGQHEKLVMGLQALGASLVSKKWVREQIGVPDNASMVEEILGEQVDDMVLATMAQALQQAATPEQATQVESAAEAYLSGDTTAHPLLALPAAPPGPPALEAGPPGLSSAPQPGGPPLPGIPGGTGFPQPPPGRAG